MCCYSCDMLVCIKMSQNQSCATCLRAPSKLICGYAAHARYRIGNLDRSRTLVGMGASGEWLHFVLFAFHRPLCVASDLTMGMPRGAVVKCRTMVMGSFVQQAPEPQLFCKGSPSGKNAIMIMIMIIKSINLVSNYISMSHAYILCHLTTSRRHQLRLRYSTTSLESAASSYYTDSQGPSCLLPDLYLNDGIHYNILFII